MPRKKKEENEFNLDDYKKEIDEYIKERANKELSSEVVKIYKKEISKRKKQNFLKNIIIIILLLVIAYGLNYWNRHYRNIKPVIVEKKEINKEEKEDNTLIEENKYLLDNIKIYKEFNYQKDIEDKNLSDELKEYLSFNNIKEEIKEEDGIYILDENKLKDKMNEMFDGENNLKTFKYNGVTIRYLESKNIFILDKNIKDSKELDKSIKNVTKERDTINIETEYNDFDITYVFKNNKLISIK